MQPPLPDSVVGTPVETPVSAIQATERVTEVKSKNQLLRLSQELFPKLRLRILTDATDGRSGGHAVAICEQDVNGKLTVLVGAPSLTLAYSFAKVKVDEDRVPFDL